MMNWLMQWLISNHAFIDGNKPVAVTAPGIFLEVNGQRLTTTKAEVPSSPVKMRAEEAETEQIAS